MINRFSGKYRFLSNFYPSGVVLDAHGYPTVEHAFQAAKTTVRKWRIRIARAPGPGAAKRLGRRVDLRPGWDDMRNAVMLDLLRQKFAKPTLRARLMDTGDQQLIEGNHWGDTYWGVCDGVGQNMLGRLLMQVRDEIRFEDEL